MDVDASADVLIANESGSEDQINNPIVKSEPIDSVDLLLDDDLRLQIEKSIELVVEEFSRNGDCLTENMACDDVPVEHGISTDLTSVTEMDPVEEQSDNNLEENHNSNTNTENVSSSCVKVVEFPPKIPNDITVIPINTGKLVNIKSEPKDTTDADRRFKKLLHGNVSSTNETSSATTKGIYLPSLTSGKNSALSILPVNSNNSKPIVPEGSTKPKIRSNAGEFSLTADVTIKSVPSTNTSAGNPPPYRMNNSSSANPTLKKAYSGDASLQSAGHGVLANIRSNSLPSDHRLGLPLTPQIYPDGGIKPDISNHSVPFNSKYCYKGANAAAPISMADLSSCSYPPSACVSKSCSGQSPALAQCHQSPSLALMPYSSQPSSICGSNFNSYAPSSPLSSPKHLKPPINSLNSCRMSSSSPVPAYMRSREPSYSAPILCDSFSATSLIPPETSSFKSTPPWNTPPSSSFRSPTSPATFNFALPSPTMGSIAPPPPSNPIFPSCSNQNALMLPSGHQKSAQNSSYPFRSNFTPSFNPNSSFQRAQCCFSSQIQCFNSACASSQQQFSIVQHSTRLSNLKSNSIDSVSSLLQYHTYFKKY